MVSRGLRYVIGVVLSLNFLAYWAVPVAGMGSLYKYGLVKVGRPLFEWLDAVPALRAFAAKHVYAKEQFNDFFIMSVLTTASMLISLAVLLRQQLAHGYLPWWMIFAYYCQWVGLGGRSMGTAYTMAHKEGHNVMLYQRWFRRFVGNWFENKLGVFYGNVPYNFQTSHVHIHHKLDGGVGDTFYQWDLDRSSLSDFMLYVYRIMLHMCGYSSLRYFAATQRKGMYDKLRAGCVHYWVYVPAALLLVTKSASFVFFVFLQPLVCMTTFLALLNFGFHGFVEFDEDGNSIPAVNSTCIIEGDDDSWGEDDHNTHHYSTTVYHRDLPAHHKTKIADFAKHKGSVFRGLSILELSIFLLAGDFDRLASHFVDYSGTMSRAEVAALLEARAKRKEMTYDEYEALLASGKVYALAEGKAKPAEARAAAQAALAGQ
mmetsp:Transcript_3441/g.11450  ORF Transcript_3441/g.11450 Transcript_3441/m.11450 type:complete len:429 (+) Transcript_3441:101-1387(+)